MPYVPPSEYPYVNDSAPGAADGDIVFAEIPNHIMAYLQDELPFDIAAAAATSIDHGTTTGLLDDDHPQYATADGLRGNFEAFGAVTTHVAASDPHGDRAYADSLFASNDALVYKGVIDCSTNPNYPAADAGDTYRISVAGKIGGASGVDVEVGDLATCTTDSTASGNQATVGSFWNVVQTNLDGVVLGPVTTVVGRAALWANTTGSLLSQSSAAPILEGDSRLTDDRDPTAHASTHGDGGSDEVSLNASQIVSGTVATARLGSGTASASTVLSGAQTYIDPNTLPVTVNLQTDDYTLVLSDQGKVVEMNKASSNSLTVPPNADVAFPTGTLIEVCQVGAGTTSIVAGSGVTIRNVGALNGQWCTASLRKRGTNEWILTGELA